jgi:hypothetical protein
MSASIPPEIVRSQREVARRLGISHTALQKAERTGRIAQEPGGGWDLEKIRSLLVATSDPVRPTASLASQPAVPSGAPDAPAAPAQGGSFHNARTANEMLKAQDRKLRLDERRGTLVDKARALTLVHRLAKEERDAVLAWPARVAPELAAELGVDPHRLHTLLDARLRQHLAERNSVRIEVV